MARGRFLWLVCPWHGAFRDVHSRRFHFLGPPVRPCPPMALHAQGYGQQPVLSVGTQTGGLQSGPHTCPSQSVEPGGDRGAFSLQAQQPRGPGGRAGCASRTLRDRDQVSGQMAGHLGAAQHPWQHPEQEMMVASDRQ